MDRIKKYVVAGRPVTGKRVLTWSFGIALLIALAVVGILNYAARQLDPLLAEVPVVEIKNGVSIRPENTVWEKTFSESGFTVRIDTRDSNAESTEGNGVTLMRDKVVVKTPQQAETFPLPDENLTMDRVFWAQTLKTGIANMGIVLGVMAFVGLFLGYWGTVGLTCLFGRIIGRLWPIDMIRRVAAVGWISILVLDVILMLTARGFSVWIAMGFATVLSVLCLSWPIEGQ